MLVIKLVILRDNVKSQLKGHAKSVCYEEEKYCQLELKPASSVDISSKLFVSCESRVFFHCQANLLKW